MSPSGFRFRLKGYISSVTGVFVPVTVLAGLLYAPGLPVFAQDSGIVEALPPQPMIVGEPPRQEEAEAIDPVQDLLSEIAAEEERQKQQAADITEIESQAMPFPELVGEGEGAVPMPQPNQLQSAEPVAENLEAQISAIPEARPVEPGPDVFYDAGSTVPTGQMTSAVPRKVNPVLQPASRLIVVKKAAGKTSRDAQLVSAQRAMKLGRFEAALEMYDRLYLKNRNDERILMGRAVALQRLDRPEAAIHAYEELLERNPDNLEARINMLGVLSTRFPAVALRRLVDLREEHPNHAGIVAQLAVTHAQMREYDQAIRALNIASSMEPKNASHILNMAVIADRAGDQEKAVKYYEEALEIDSVYGGGRSIPRDSVFERLAHLR